MPINKLVSSVILLVLIPGSILSIGLVRDSLCITPNGEPARCIGINSCGVFREATMLNIPGVLEFLQMSLCGHDKGEPLICCGTTALKSELVIPCVTPNNENATCLPLSSCPLLQDKSKDETEEARDFLRLSQCGHYSDQPHFCCATKAAVSETNPLLPLPFQCGINSGYKNIYDNGRLNDICPGVIGGLPVGLGDFPWAALLRYKYYNGEDAGFKCGGSLINTKYVVTAGHCLMINPAMGYDIDSVRLGEWKISTIFDCNNEICINPVIDLKIAKVFVHPKYSSALKINDIALLKLDGEVEYSDYIRPICLPPQGHPTPKHGTEVTVTGWGITEHGSTSDIKLSVDVPIVSNDMCSKMLNGWNEITDNHTCAGGEEGRDACKGDSGGPLMAKRHMIGNYQYYLHGVVSWGVQCGASRFPGVYTKVSMYIQWIIDNLEN